jgi:hypothetical protein
VVPQVQGEAVRQAQARAVAVTRAQAPTVQGARDVQAAWVEPGPEAVAGLIGVGAGTDDASDAERWLRDRALRQVGTVRDALAAAVAGDLPVEELRERLLRAVELPLGGAQGAARDAMMRAYDGATGLALAANEGLLADEWMWVGSLSGESCAACVGLHGRRFGMQVAMMPRHGRCRCSRVPVLADEDGLLGTIETGDAWFARQDATTQAKILRTQVAVEGFQRGEVELGDFIEAQKDGAGREHLVGTSFKRAQLNAADRAAGIRGDVGRRPFGVPVVEPGEPGYWTDADRRQALLPIPGQSPAQQALNKPVLATGNQVTMSDRHVLGRLGNGASSGKANSVAELWVPVDAELDAIRRGDVPSVPGPLVVQGTTYAGRVYTINGRRYAVENTSGHAYLVDGPGVLELSFDEHVLLKSVISTKGNQTGMARVMGLWASGVAPDRVDLMLRLAEMLWT